MTPLERLHDALLDGALDAGQVAELRTLLADPAQRQAWRQLSALAGRLHEELGAVAMPALAPARPRMRPRPAGRRLFWPGLAAAAMLALLLTGWLFLREQPSAPVAEPNLAAGQLAEGRLSVDGVALQPGDSIRADSPATAAGDGVMVLADGSRCAWTGAARFTLGAGGASLRLDAGDLRVQAARQPAGRSFGVVTADCTVQVIGTHFRVLGLADRTCVAVEEGEVMVLTGAGQAAVAAGQATTALAGKIPEVHPLAPPARWAMELDAPLQPGWLGRPVPGGLAAVASPDDPRGDPRCYVRTPRTPPPGLAGLQPGLTFTARISAARPGPVEVFLVCNDPLTDDFRGLLHAKASLSGGGTAETLELGLDRFVPTKAGDPLAGNASVSCVILQWWGDDLGSVVSSVSLEP